MGGRIVISIHAPHAGRDHQRRCGGSGLHISIHAPHAGRDTARPTAPMHFGNFNPRAPCGARRRVVQIFHPWDKFQSTRPMRGATDYRALALELMMISIHAPHAGRD